MQQFDRHKIVFLHQEGDSQSAISLKTGTSQYSVQCGSKIKAAGLKETTYTQGTVSESHILKKQARKSKYAASKSLSVFM